MDQRLSRWRLVLFLLAVYVVIRVGIPFLVGVGIPFELRAALLALLPLLGYRVGPRLYVQR